jgi:polyhydroxybutyrate depolymerase
MEPVTDRCFADVAADAWYAPFVCAAKRRGIVSGYSVGSRKIFRPDQPIIFAEAVKMAVLAYGNEVTEGRGEEWYEPYANELDRQNILARWSYVPWDPIARERAADLIARFIRHDEDRTPANLSAGCGKIEKRPALSLTVHGIDRSYLLTEPRRTRSSVPSPLIVAFHGRTNSNEQVRSYFGLDRAASDFFIAYPAGISSGKGSFSWSDPGDRAHELRDIAFFDAIVEEIGESVCIDMDKIFVVGHSLGAWFANSVACARGGVVRASATVGGSTTMQNCSGPSAAMIINNPKDTLSSHTAAETMRDIRLRENACGASKEKADPASLSCTRYSDCGKNPVVFCPHSVNHERDGRYYPHLWPRETGETVVKFFESL